MMYNARIALLGAAVLLAAGCSHHEKANKVRPVIPVQTIVVAPQNTSATTRYIGSIEPIRETPLSLQTAGRVISVNVKDGDRVRKGQVILRVDNTQALNALETAKAALRQAQDAYDRVKQVHEKGAVTDQKMVEIESQLARARSMEAAARQQVNECTLTAPDAGVVSGLTIQIGQTVVPGARLCALLDVTAFSVKFTVPETEIGCINVGDKGDVDCAAANVTLPIIVEEKSLKANPLSHTYEVKGRIEGDTRALMPGMIGKVRMSGLEAKGVEEKGVEANDQEIIIPARCILLKPEGPTVWLKINGEAVRRNIVIDGYRADGVLVKDGLQAGDSLITEGYQKLYMNCKIEDK